MFELKSYVNIQVLWFWINWVLYNEFLSSILYFSLLYSMVLWGIIIKNISDALLLSCKCVNLSCLPDSGCLKKILIHSLFSLGLLLIMYQTPFVTVGICLLLCFLSQSVKNRRKDWWAKKKKKKVFFEEKRHSSVFLKQCILALKQKLYTSELSRIFSPAISLHNSMFVWMSMLDFLL